MWRRSRWIYDDPLEAEDDDAGPRQHTGPHGININIETRRPSLDPEVTLDSALYGPRLSRGYRHIHAPLRYRTPTPAFDMEHLRGDEPLPRFSGYRSSNRHRLLSTSYRRRSPFAEDELVTVLLPRNETAVIDMRLLDAHLPNARRFVQNRVLDVPAYLRDHHRTGIEGYYPQYAIELPAVARHVFTFLTESAPAAFADTFDEWRLVLDGGETVQVMRVALRAFAMCCLLDQRRSLGCSEALGRQLMAFVYVVIQPVAGVDAFFVPLLFGGAARVLAEAGRDAEPQERMLRHMWRLIDQGDSGMSEVLEQNYQRMAAAGGAEGARARRVLGIIRG